MPILKQKPQRVCLLAGALLISLAFSLGRANSERSGVGNNYDRYYDDDVNNYDNDTKASY
jgi:hypothetical protein